MIIPREDVCSTTIEIVTPYWASNSNGKVRAILNNKEFEQAIHQEICGSGTTARCNRDCSCQQKYKWHRLMAYDPNYDCAGIFMDWFLFPSCCVCRSALIGQDPSRYCALIGWDPCPERIYLCAGVRDSFFACLPITLSVFM